MDSREVVETSDCAREREQRLLLGRENPHSCARALGERGDQLVGVRGSASRRGDDDLEMVRPVLLRLGRVAPNAVDGLAQLALRYPPEALDLVAESQELPRVVDRLEADAPLACDEQPHRVGAHIDDPYPHGGNRGSRPGHQRRFVTARRLGRAADRINASWLPRARSPFPG